MNLDLIKNNTKWEDAANSINSNFNKTNLELTKIAASSVKHKGYFTTEAALLAAQPSPRVGDNAYVGATYPGVVYVCNTAGTWTATTTVPSPPAVDIAEYYKKTETDTLVNVVSGEVDSLRADLNNVSNGHNTYGVATGTAQAQILTVPLSIDSLKAGMSFFFKPIASNTGSNPTLSINGTAAKTILPGNNYYYSTTLLGGDLAIGIVAHVVYDGSYFRLQNPQSQLNKIALLSSIAIGFIARSPDWSIDSYYNVTIPSGVIDIYYNGSFIRINTIHSFSIHSGSSNICLDLTDNSIKRVDTPIKGTHVVLGTYYGDKLFVNGFVNVITATDEYSMVSKKTNIEYIVDEKLDSIVETICKKGTVVATTSSIVVDITAHTTTISGQYFDIYSGTEFIRYSGTQTFNNKSGSTLVIYNKSTGLFRLSDTCTDFVNDIAIASMYADSFYIFGTCRVIYSDGDIGYTNIKKTEIQAIVNDTAKNTLPSFVLSESFSTFKRLSNWINGEEVFLIAQITDVHSGFSNKYLHVGYLSEIQKIFGFNILWNGGDIGLDVGETLEEAYQLLYNTKKMMDASCPFILTIGNHDYGTSAIIPSQTINDIFNAPQKRKFSNVFINNNGYGYIDDDRNNIRTYILNTSENNSVYNMSITQLQWLSDNLSSLSDGWKIVILTHLCVDPIGRSSAYPTDADGIYFDTFRSIMSAFVSKTNGINSSTGVSWGFSSVPPSVKLICNMSGDSHFNNFTVTNGVNYIVRQGYGYAQNVNMPIGSTKDYFNSNTQCLFDILAVKHDGSAKIFRIGAGGDTRDLEFNY